ncbi:MAG: phosphatidylserine decarboxylase family protein [Prevotellaceae bacterium]|jgi:phosphatidylserine decarboxylase|nr:phosphatidylserine decarboxylase family protein [Prevotellaceae bacterium]
MRIHKEGTLFIIFSLILLLAIAEITIWYTTLYMLLLTAGALFLFGFIVRFFRYPKRPLKKNPGAVLAPADGKVVIIEEVEESEYFKDKRLQVSIFMSPNNVHINWMPVSGTIEYFKYHKGKYLVAWHPKSSVKNERSSIVVNTGKTKILLRQIAGYVARRIVWYVKEGDKKEQNEQFGFIKFGSRIDLFLPADTEVEVELGQKVVGTETVIAYLD